MKIPIRPAILEESFDGVADAIGRAADIADAVQIDIVDGVYAPSATWPFTVLEDASQVSDMNKDLLKEVQRFYTIQTTFELDLMIQNPEDTLGLWLVTDAERFVIHHASTRFLTYCVTRIKEGDREVFIGLTSDNTFSDIEPVVDVIDGVQCMGIAQVGKQGEPYNEGIEVLIREISNARPRLPIQVDGGVSAQTIPRLLAAGATQFAAGSALFSGDVKENFSGLQEACVGVS